MRKKQVPRPGNQQDALDAYKRYALLMVRGGFGATPKLHLMSHLLSRMADLGSPGMYSCWLDESLNKACKRACRNASQQTFEAGLLCRMLWMLENQHRDRVAGVFG